MILGMQISNISFTFLLVFYLDCCLILRDAVSLVLKDEGFTFPFPQAKTAISIEKTLTNQLLRLETSPRWGGWVHLIQIIIILCFLFV